MIKAFGKYTPIYIKQRNHHKCVGFRVIYQDKKGYFIKYKKVKTYVEPFPNEMAFPAFEIKF